MQPFEVPQVESDLLMPISDVEFQTIRTLVYDRFGINLTDQKRGLVVGRLQRVLKTKGLQNFSEYCKYIEQDQSGQALVELVNRISTNYTYFNRENAHFDFFVQHALPKIVQQLKLENSKDIRIWSAGCSTGEEPYYLVMLMMEYFGREYGLWDAGILATDISARVLQNALAGVYSEEQIGRVPKHLINKYFTKEKNGRFKVIDAVKKEVIYRRFNLMNKYFPFRKPFHIIFCRNVMIYFDRPTRMALVDRFFNVTAPKGYLFIGHSESLGRGETPYKYIMPAVYEKAGI